eukprot:PhM_4_TR11376/c0_g1_i1/m.28925
MDRSRCLDLVLTVSERRAERTDAEDFAHTIVRERLRAQPLCFRDTFVKLMKDVTGTDDADVTREVIAAVCNAPCREVLVSWCLHDPHDQLDRLVADDEASVLLERAYSTGLHTVRFYCYGIGYDGDLESMVARSRDGLGTMHVLTRTSMLGLRDDYVALDDIVSIQVENHEFHIPLQCVQANPRSLLARYVAQRGAGAHFRVSGIPARVFQYVVDYFTSGIVELDKASSTDIPADVKVLLRWDVPAEAIIVERDDQTERLEQERQQACALDDAIQHPDAVPAVSFLEQQHPAPPTPPPYHTAVTTPNSPRRRGESEFLVDDGGFLDRNHAEQNVVPDLAILGNGGNNSSYNNNNNNNKRKTSVVLPRIDSRRGKSRDGRRPNTHQKHMTSTTCTISSLSPSTSIDLLPVARAVTRQERRR